MGNIKLTIFIPSVHTRRATFLQKSMDMLYGQLESLPKDVQAKVEILYLVDNKTMMLGSKRNIGVDIAQGEYISHVDCDDEVPGDYILTLLEAIDKYNTDVISFTAMVTVNGNDPKPCYYSIENKRDYNTDAAYYRIPNHICCVKKSVSLKSSFPNILKGEDAGYSKLLLPHLKTEHKIDKVLYYYNYNDKTTETQMELPSTIRQRNLTPIVDVVILSRADTAQMKAMTQKTIDTCIAGANSLPVNVMVVEQCDGVIYDNAKTIFHAEKKFNYNAFMNLGARQGEAKWILMSNNDLIFKTGWLHNMLIMDHPVMSPHEERDPRQRGLSGNETGFVNGRHLCGWCYLIKRETWENIGGLDEEFDGWYADDSVIEQVKAIGIKPMIVKDSHVQHLGSKTLSQLDEETRGELCWGKLERFNEKYNQKKFEGNIYYKAWKENKVKSV